MGILADSVSKEEHVDGWWCSNWKNLDRLQCCMLLVVVLSTMCLLHETGMPGYKYIVAESVLCTTALGRLFNMNIHVPNYHIVILEVSG